MIVEVRGKGSPTVSIRIVTVPGLSDGLRECYDRGVLPAEHGRFDWARSGRRVDIGPDFASARRRREPPVAPATAVEA